ncbi:hypothetical protein, partial [Alistipes putredinis]|uniref:hypothetical protein n=1 Tax=Alistipes putredinis TaxID=28117 RepID=UPI003AF14064
MQINENQFIVCILLPGKPFFVPPPSNFQNSPRLGDRRAGHIVSRVDRFDYLGECERFPGVLISVGMKQEYPSVQDTLSC